MGLYRDQILPRAIDRMLGVEAIMRERAIVADGLHGEVVEIGFGSGLNVEVYPAEVTTVHAVDPAAVGRKLAADRVAASPAEVRHVGLDGEDLPLDDESCDGALSTFTLCTIPDAQRAVAEVWRVLRPGGAFHVLEHGLAPDPSVVAWQRRLNPIQRRLGDGCHLDRPHDRMLRDAGFVLETNHQWYAAGPKPMSRFYRIVARKPG